jgi:hypothetical protein
VPCGSDKGLSSQRHDSYCLASDLTDAQDKAWQGMALRLRNEERGTTTTANDNQEQVTDVSLCVCVCMSRKDPALCPPLVDAWRALLLRHSM